MYNHFATLYHVDYRICGVLRVVFLFRIVLWSIFLVLEVHAESSIGKFSSEHMQITITGKNNTYFIFPKEAVSNRTNCWSSVFNLQHNKVRKFYNCFDSWTWNPDSCYRINIPVYYLSNVPCKQIEDICLLASFFWQQTLTLCPIFPCMPAGLVCLRTLANNLSQLSSCLWNKTSLLELLQNTLGPKKFWIRICI